MSPGTSIRWPAPSSGPVLFCALAPWILFRYAMATLVAPYAFLWHPDRWVPPLPPALPFATPIPCPFFFVWRPRATRSRFVTAYHVLRPIAVPGFPPPPKIPVVDRDGALRWGPFPLFLLDIAQSDDAERLPRDLDMLKDAALEAADEAVRAPDPALSHLCDALRWTAADGALQAITAVTGAWTPRGLLLTATVTVTTGPSEVKIVDDVPLTLAQGGPLLEYVSNHPDTLTATLITRWSPGHSPVSNARLRHIMFPNLYSAREKAPPTDTEAAPDIQNQKVSFKL